MDRRLKDWGLVAVGALVVYAGVALVEGTATAGEPTTGDLLAVAGDPAALQARLEAGERLVWSGPAHRQTMVLRLGQGVVLLERGLRHLDAQVGLRRDGAFLVVEGPATVRREQDAEGARRMDASTLLGLPWGAPPDTAPPAAPPSDSRLQMIEGDASIARVAAPAAVSVNKGGEAPLVERDKADLGEFAEGKVEVGGSQLTLLEHTNLRVLSIGPTSSVVEVLGVQLELQRGTIIEAAFGSLVLNIQRGAATVRPGSAPQIPEIRITNLDPGTGILTVTTVQLAPGQEFGAGPTGVWTTPGSASPISVTVTLSVPVYDADGQVVGRETVTTFQGQAPVGTAPPVPVLVDAIARVMASGDPAAVGPMVEALTNGTSVTELGLASLVTNYTGDPDLVDVMQGALAHLGTAGSRGGSPSEEDAPGEDGEGGTSTTSSGGGGSEPPAGHGGEDDEADARTIEIFFTYSSVPGDGLVGGVLFAQGNPPPQSIDHSNSQNSTGTNTIIGGGNNTGGNTGGSVTPTSSASFR